MKIEQLRYVVEVAKTKSINQAAANLYMSQPNLSTAIRNLEEELGCVLIQRTNRGIQLTRKGEDFVNYAESILNQFDHLQMLDGFDNETACECLSISESCHTYISLMSAEFLNKHKNEPFRLILREYSKDGVIRSVESGESEIGFMVILENYKNQIIRRLQNEGLKYQHISNDRIIVKLGPNNPLYKMDGEVTREMLRQFPMVSYDELDLYHYADRAKILGITSDKPEILVNSRKVLDEMLMNTDAFAVITSHGSRMLAPKDYSEKGLKRMYVKDCFVKMDFGVIYENGAILSPLAREFLETVIEDSTV